MADLTDVGNALVALAAQTIYPNGIGQASIANVDVRVFQGWPNPENLDVDLLAGKAQISVFVRPEERNTTRYPTGWKQQAAPVQTLTLTINGQQVTVGGTVSTPQNVALLVNRQSYGYAVQANDTLTTIATALAALIPGASSAGAVVTLPSSANVTAARVGASAQFIRELKRQQRVFQISIWTPTPAMRDTIAQALDVALAAAAWLTMPDQTGARLIYKSSMVTDDYQKNRLYRRDLMYSVEYATTQTTTATQIIGEQVNVTAQDSTAGQISVATLNL